MNRKTLIAALLAIFLIGATSFAAEIISGSTIAFNRGGDIWLMEADGSNQRPWVAGLANVRGRMHWSPDNNKLVFARTGQVQVQFPDGGGHRHMAYDLFYAYPDSADNWWEGITQTLGGFAPQFTADGSKVLFVHDRNAADADAIYPEYRLAFWDTKTFEVTDIELTEGSKLVTTSPAISPDGKRVAFSVMQLSGTQFTPAGIAIASVSEFPLSDEELLTRARRLGDASSPSWSPDGKWIAYVSNDMSNPGLYVTPPDLSERKLLYTPPAGLTLTGAHPSWSPDSQMLLFSTVNGSIYKISLNGGEPERLSGPGNDTAPAWCN